MKKIFVCFLLLIVLCGCSQSEETYISSDSASVSVTTNDFKITCTTAKQIYGSRLEISKENPLPLEVRIEYIGDEQSIKVRSRTSFSHVYWETPMEGSGPNVVQEDAGRETVFYRDAAYVEKLNAKFWYDHYGRLDSGEYTAYVTVEFYTVEVSPDEANAQKVTANFKIPIIVQ